MAALEILELVGGLAECWCWFALTGSCLVWVVTLGSVWLEDDHPHWAALVGLMVHVAVISMVVYFWGGSGGGGEKGKENATQGKVAIVSIVHGQSMGQSRLVTGTSQATR